MEHTGCGRPFRRTTMLTRPLAGRQAFARCDVPWRRIPRGVSTATGRGAGPGNGVKQPTPPIFVTAGKFCVLTLTGARTRVDARGDGELPNEAGMKWIVAFMLMGLCCVQTLAQSPEAVPQRAAPRSAPSTESTETAQAAPTMLNAAALLRANIAELSLEEEPLAAVLEKLGARLGINVIALWPALERVGVYPDTPISLRVRNLPVQTVLWLILQQAEPPGEVLAYWISGNLMVVSTRRDFSDEMVVQVYDVRSLVAGRTKNAGISIGETRDYVAGLRPVVGGSVGMVAPIIRRYNSGWTLNGFPYDSQADAHEFSEAGHQQRMEQLIRAITATIAPESWEVNGGPGTIVPFRDQLVVRNSPLVHQQLGGPKPEPEE